MYVKARRVEIEGNIKHTELIEKQVLLVFWSWPPIARKGN
jgi:hypothetical protein